MKKISLILCGFLSFTVVAAAQAKPTKVFNLNVFDQLQGTWETDFREKRMKNLEKFISKENPDIITFQEAQGDKPGAEGGGKDSADVKLWKKKYPHRSYIHEMTGKDGASYGYWIGSKKKPSEWISDGFSFPGGVERKVLGGIWGKGKSCFGIISLHLSYQTSEVRQKEATWILDWLKAHEKKCARWLVVGDFNADKEDQEMKNLFAGGLKSLYSETKPSVGAFNPIRKIYGENIPSKTIDWALGWNMNANAKLVLDSPWNGEWVSDHAGVLIDIDK